ncbi:MAG: tetratricopeptide repeat protein [Gemmatimonadales bacterium]
MRRSLTAAAILLLLATGRLQGQMPEHAHTGQASHDSGSVPLFTNLGSYHAPITAASQEVRAYFDQGIRLLYAFNHAEAIRAFEEAERLDPNCAMCAWGIALAAGPNINAPMDSATAVPAWAAVERALENLSGVTPREVDFIRALSLRYSPDPSADRARLDSAYATAMGELADRYPEDQEAQVLYADALMNLSPWYYWVDGIARPATPVILSRLRGVLDVNPDHPGACHLYIHAVEAHLPERAVACAERLASLMPGAGHIVHMPGHIYIRVGRYADAIEANRHAVHADETYLEGPMVARQGLYPQGYYPHNYHFMNFAATLAGDGETAIMAARKVMVAVSFDVARQHPFVEAITPVVYTTMVTFGRWDDILKEPLPPSDLRYTTGMAYYARGMAFAAKGRWAEARAAVDTVASVAAAMSEGDNRTAMTIGAHALRGEIALRRGETKEAVKQFAAGLELENGMLYTEPPVWYYPIRHSYGKALMAADRFREAEQVYREDLREFPENGWSLFGLAESLEEQGRSAEAEKVRARFEQAWKSADIELTASRM